MLIKEIKIIICSILIAVSMYSIGQLANLEENLEEDDNPSYLFFALWVFSISGAVIGINGVAQAYAENSHRYFATSQNPETENTTETPTIGCGAV